MQYPSRSGIIIIDQQFLLFIAQLPAAPSSARVALWRRLRGAGASSVLNGAWVLPRTEEHARFFSQLADTVRSQDGSAQVFAVSEVAPAEREALIGRFQADREREYGEFEDRSGAFLKEIDRETKRRKFTFAELEEIEDEFEKLKVWLDKIRARDFFPNEGTQRAEDALERCSGARDAFAEAVYAHEGVGGDNESSAKPKAAS